MAEIGYRRFWMETQIKKLCDDRFKLAKRINDLDQKILIKKAAHFINRQHMNTRYERMNVNATSIQSNRFDDNHKDQYLKKMLEVYGLERVESLKRRGNSLQKYTRSDLIDLINAFKLSLKELRK